MKFSLQSGFIVMLWLFVSSWANGQNYPAGFSEELVTANLTDPTALAFAPSSDDRIFVAEQGGTLRIIENGSLLSTHVLGLTVNSDGERGLLGIAIDAAFTSNQYIYLYHTEPSPLHNRITRYTLSGGAMVFGPDDKLYVGVGENANGVNAQQANVGNLYYLSRTNGALYKIVYNGPAAIVESHSDPVLAVYPQPAYDKLNIDLNTKFTGGGVNFIDRFGNNLSLPMNIEGLKFSINVSSLPVGVYALRIGDSDKMVTRKISIIR